MISQITWTRRSLSSLEPHRHLPATRYLKHYKSFPTPVAYTTYSMITFHSQYEVCSLSTSCPHQRNSSSSATGAVLTARWNLFSVSVTIFHPNSPQSTTSHVDILSGEVLVLGTTTPPEQTSPSCSAELHLANIDPQIAWALMKTNDHIAVDVLLRRHHHYTPALRSGNSKRCSDTILMRNQ